LSYLYGDSSQSALKSNFLEFLRDAMDFAVIALQSDARLALGRQRVEQLRKESAAESQRLARFIALITAAIEPADKGEPDSPTAQCAVRVVTLLSSAEQATNTVIEEQLSAEIARMENEEIATRKATAKALAELLVPHDPPETTTATRVALEGGRYTGTRACSTPFGLSWIFEVAIDEQSLWSALVRIERLNPQLEIRAPSLSGWISKEVKVRPQRIEKLLVTELFDDGSNARVKLRGEAAAADSGFDLMIDASRNLTMKRVGPTDDASVGDFDVAEEDTEALVQLVQKLREKAAELPPRKLVSAAVDDIAFDLQPDYEDVVKRLIGAMAPMVRQISERSQTPHELVIRRLISEDRREEIFVSKATLREKYAGLGDAARAVFAPLALDPANARMPTAEYPPPQGALPRAELPKSRPPPPPTPSRPSAPTPPPRRDRSPEAPAVIDLTDAAVEARDSVAGVEGGKE
jgi:hypothetical protein